MTQLHRSALLHAALDTAQRGWYVHPLRPGGKAPALHGESACPRIGDCADGHRKWEQRATLDAGRIRRAWSGRPFNVGIATGPSGLVVVDLDVPKEGAKDAPCGAATFRALCERAGQPIPETFTVRTAGGGWHLYFTAPEGVRLRNTSRTLGPGIDTRAWGGYVVAPGSSIDGRLYVFAAGVRPEPLPTWLLEAITATTGPAAPRTIAPARNASRCAQVALEREGNAVANAVKGEREATLFKAARAMGRFVAWGDIPRDEVEEAFQVVGEACGLKPHECRSTLRSALNWSIRTAKPRGAA
ncbi:bifunctional DNA primase/polymerase [Streptomyces sp. WMMB 322]|uniref:bifunctional DNA primase/polymerase n=1 Tax=Streptomyces sp. WMMB 322 TaxID=1286821 RepID=UPI0006E140AB|nr:bifunctional DNA primase/polymerase [Streptomyces sp. WMMB 322]SCK47276.1 Bifunctional DNA primase/polymerase, N-terminal [Streptomyces sp. WMMB 322]